MPAVFADVVGIGLGAEHQNVVVAHVAVHATVMGQVDEVRRAKDLDRAPVFLTAEPYEVDVGQYSSPRYGIAPGSTASGLMLLARQKKA